MAIFARTTSWQSILLAIYIITVHWSSWLEVAIFARSASWQSITLAIVTVHWPWLEVAIFASSTHWQSIPLASHCYVLLVQNLCGDRLGVWLCPSTCGFCALFNSSLCQDIVQHDGCSDLQVAENLCDNKPVAMDVCPVTCSLCGELGMCPVICSLCGEFGFILLYVPCVVSWYLSCYSFLVWRVWICPVICSLYGELLFVPSPVPCVVSWYLSGYMFLAWWIWILSCYMFFVSWVGICLVTCSLSGELGFVLLYVPWVVSWDLSYYMFLV